MNMDTDSTPVSEVKAETGTQVGPYTTEGLRAHAEMLALERRQREAQTTIYLTFAPGIAPVPMPIAERQAPARPPPPVQALQRRHTDDDDAPIPYTPPGVIPGALPAPPAPPARVNGSAYRYQTEFDELFSLVSKKAGGAFEASLYQASGGLYGVGRAASAIAGAAVGVNPEKNTPANWLANRARIEHDKAAVARPITNGMVESGVYSGLESAAANLLLTPLAFVPGGRAAAMTGMIAPGFGNTFQENAEGKPTPFGQRARQQLQANGIPATSTNIRALADAVNELRTATVAPDVPPPALATLLRAELLRTGQFADPGAVQRAYLAMRPALAAAIHDRPRQ